MGQIRLYIAQPLSVNNAIELDEKQSHYLTHVMKRQVGDSLLCFDNQSGEYLCEIAETSKKHCVLHILKLQRSYCLPPDIWLIFAPVKKDNTDFIVQKATELGVRKIIPVLTRYTISERVKKERFIAQTIEAAEQCRRVDLPEVAEVIDFENLLKCWPTDRKLYYLDETLNSKPPLQAFINEDKCAVLVGPEGGFSLQELEQLRKAPFATGVTLGNRILRAETAAVAALACWQALRGDWK
ncbi:MAG: 16S rRNA (uracil(1498)-N(3))-methyltransferase [Alphaproteobacteria bacterium]|nr:16S rRNA (uracil(1498)-N(3))-methyltransferase [Alphaproteobacteria bacterium]